MKEAIKIYNMFLDMDYFDYIENLDSDLLFIKSLIDTIGTADTIRTLEEYFK